MNGKSLTPQEEKLKQLREIFPEVFAEGKVDIEKLRATLGENVHFTNERYVLNWAGKSDAFKMLQEATSKTLVPAREESMNFDETENIFIEGENMEVLKALQRSYFGKIKMIYIDPPYNTGNDSFIYPDKFSETKYEYETRVGDKDENGYMTRQGMFHKNAKENGQYHSNWLSMMYPRLFLAKSLLRQDGVIFISIDDNEVHNLRLMMDEIFGEENFVDSICWKKKYGGGAKEKYLVSVHEYVLLYAKNLKELPEILVEFNLDKARRFYKFKDKKFDKLGYYRTHPLEAVKSFDLRENLHFPITAPDGTDVYPKRQWRWSKERFKEALKNDEVIFSKNKDGKWVLSSKQYLNDENGIQRKTKAQSILDDIYTQEGTKEVIELFEDAKLFSFPKPIKLMKSLIQIGEGESNDIILDFFAGSGTTAHAVMQLNKEDGGNRKCISVQLPEKCDEKSEAYKAGYTTIADISKERIRRASKKIQQELTEENHKKKEELSFEEKKRETKLDLGFKVFKLTCSNFKQWQQPEKRDLESLKKQMELMVDRVTEHATTENMVYELLLKNGKDLNSKIEHKKNYHCINTNELIFMLEETNEKIVEAVIQEKPQKVIVLDRLFKGNDQLKTNTFLQMRDAGIEFQSI